MPVFYSVNKIPKIGDKVKVLNDSVFTIVDFVSGISLMTEKCEYEGGIKKGDTIIGYEAEDRSFDSRAILIFESGRRLKVPIQDIDEFINIVKANKRDGKLNKMGI